MDPVTGGAAIATLAMAVTGGVTSLVNNYDTAKKLKDYLELLEDLYNYQIEEADLKFNQAKDTAEKNAAQANKQADITDLSQDVTEVETSESINAAIDNLYLSQTEDAMNWNAQARSSGQAQGAGLAALSTSGIRAGSSMAEAVNMEAAANTAQLQFSQDAKRTTDENNLGLLLANLAGTKVDIYGNRVGADVTRQNALDLVNSYAEGGYNYKLWQNNKDQMTRSYNYNKDKIEDEIKERNSFWGGFNAFFGGMAKSYVDGKNLTDMVKSDVMNFTTTLNTSNTVKKNTKLAIGMR